MRLFSKINIIIIVVSLLTGCLPVDGGEVSKNTSLDIIEAYYDKQARSIKYSINLNVVNYCYDLQIERIEKLQKENIIRIYTSLNYFDGICAQSTKKITLKSEIKNIITNYNTIELIINNKKINKIDIYTLTL